MVRESNHDAFDLFPFLKNSICSVDKNDNLNGTVGGDSSYGSHNTNGNVSRFVIIYCSFDGQMSLALPFTSFVLSFPFHINNFDAFRITYIFFYFVSSAHIAKLKRTS